MSTTPDDALWQRLEADFALVLGEIPKPEGPAMPYDIARCHGRDWPECADCLRGQAKARNDPAPRKTTCLAEHR